MISGINKSFVDFYGLMGENCNGEGMLKKFVDQLLPDLGNLEEDYRQFYLQSTVALYSVTGFFVIFANLAMIVIDVSLLRDHPDILTLVIYLRILFSIFTAVLLTVIKYRPDPELVLKATSIWMFVTIIYFISFNFLRPTSYLTTNIDLLLIFGAYLLSSQRLRWLTVMMVGFSIGSVSLMLYLKTDIPQFLRLLVPMTHLFAQSLGFISAVQIQNFRRRAFLAYVQEKQARELAIDLLRTDSLTKCMTRQYFLDAAEQELNRAKRYEHPLSVLMMDIDHFKKVNDQYGHRMGDEALIKFSEVVQSQMRQSDMFGRLGGEEFALLLPDTNIESAMKVARRIQETWAQTEIRMSVLIIPSTVSIGAVEYRAEDGTFDDLLLRSDKAMYLAKRNGRNRVETL